MSCRPTRKPRLVLRLGVTGHRPDKLPADTGPLLETLVDLLTQIGRLLVAYHHRADVDAFRDEPPVLRIVSPLAEGVDRLVVRAAQRLEVPGLEVDWQCPLPFARDAYVRTFTDAASVPDFEELLAGASAVLELGGDPEHASAAYTDVGRVVLDHSDLLLSVLDPTQPAAAGGTDQITREARQAGIAVLSIDPSHPAVPDLPHIQDQIARLLDLGAGKNDDERAQDQALCLRRRFLRERSCGWHPFAALHRAYWGLCAQGPLLLVSRRYWRSLVGGIRRYRNEAQEDWNDTRRRAERLGNAVFRRLDLAVRDSYLMADALASHYGDIHRGACALLFGLAALAVLLAFLSGAPQLLQLQGGHADVGFAVGELAVILLILGIYGYGHLRRWHQRWLDYRLLAELLRNLEFLLPMGLVLRDFRQPAHHAHDDAEQSWVYWQFRALVREAGLPTARIDGEWLRAYAGFLAQEKRGRLAKQADYHHHTALRHERLCRLLHGTTLLLFVVVIGFCSWHVFEALFAMNESRGAHQAGLANWPVLIATVFPAFGAALHGILTQGDYERIARRSEAMHHRLEGICEELRRQAGASPPNAAEIARLAREAAEVMLAETLDWRVLYRIRPLPLPA